VATISKRTPGVSGAGSGLGGAGYPFLHPLGGNPDVAILTP
jgi:hypothetical protein